LYSLPEFLQVDAGDLTVGKFDVATVVSGAAGKVKNGVEQRDEAIKAGADGATALVFKNGRLQFPDGSMKVPEKVAKRLVEILHPKTGDVVVIGTGKDAAKAEAGARAAAQTLTTIRA
jgi:altronate dehydratase